MSNGTTTEQQQHSKQQQTFTERNMEKKHTQTTYHALNAIGNNIL